MVRPTRSSLASKNLARFSRSASLAVVVAATALAPSAALAADPEPRSLFAGALFADVGALAYFRAGPDQTGLLTVGFGGRIGARPIPVVGLFAEVSGMGALHEIRYPPEVGIAPRTGIDMVTAVVASPLLEIRPFRRLELLAGPSFAYLAKEAGFGLTLRASYLFAVGKVKLGPGIAVVSSRNDDVAFTSIAASFVFEAPGE